ncbi:hypothetical protein ACG3SL_06945 [Sphingomonas sp. CJ20]
MPRLRSEWDHTAVAIPACWAGIIFLISLLLAVVQAEPGAVVPVEPAPIEVLFGIPVFTALASIAGMLLSAIPLWAGVAVMATLGRCNLGFQHPAIWALAGAAMCGGTVLACGIDLAEPAALALLFTSATCAALARRYVRWSPVDE